MRESLYVNCYFEEIVGMFLELLFPVLVMCARAVVHELCKEQRSEPVLPF